MKYFNYILGFTFIGLFSNEASFAQTAEKNIIISDSNGVKMATMPAGPQFAASGWKQFWWGKHWRREWLLPVSFPFFDIDTTAGGLTPIKKGGGHQTKSLRLLSKAGREYVLRTIDKDLELLIPEEFKGSVVNDIVNDQISTAHPYGPLAIANLAGVVGSLHTNPVIVFVGVEPKLGEFQNDFANKLCLLEERPSGDGWENTAITNYATEVVNSEKLYQKLQADNDRKVNQKEYLKIRFLDMLVNDWDRHPDQWVWTGYKKNGKTTYMPFARDRDQAFSKTDGVNLFYLSLPWILRSLRNMNPQIHDVIGVNLAAVSLDKKFMNELTEEEWSETIQHVRQSLSDSAIDNALRQMPKNIYDMSGPFLQKRLQQRRDNMPSFGMKYYRIINKHVILTGTDKEELFTINKMDKNTTSVTIQQAGKNHTTGDTIFHRVFKHRITKEINMYGLGDDDRFLFRGYKKNAFAIRTIGGEGRDKFIDSSAAKGSGKGSGIYDSDSNSIKMPATFKVSAAADTFYTNYHPRVFKFDWWKILFAPGYNPDDGITISTGFTYRKQGWHKYPFAWQQSISATVAAATGAIGFLYKGIFSKTLGKWDIEVSEDLRAPKYILNFYGYGNDTKLNNAGNSYFRVRSSGLFVNPAISRKWKYEEFNTGLIFQSVKIQSTAGKYISHPGNFSDSSVFTTKYFGGANIALGSNRFVNQKNPQVGFGYNIGASYLVNLEET
ncbi:MAG TPA: hypothetical protein VLR49_12475, partial [Ferruginibacter sp.]|nr:hypothetical protein [Ferruginibacter sp.]